MAKYIDGILKSALIEAMEHKALNDVTVVELVNTTGINRKTFYNHYFGISDLICQMISEGFTKAVAGNSGPYTWDIATKDLMYMMKENANFLHMVCDSRYCSDARQCLRQHLDKTVVTFVQESKNVLEQSTRKSLAITRDQENYLVKYYASLIFAMLEEWFVGGMKESIDEYVENIGKLSNDGVYAGISFFSQKK